MYKTYFRQVVHLISYVLNGDLCFDNKPLIKMKVLAESEKAKCVLWMHELKSSAAVQKKYRTYFNSRKSAPSRGSITKWYNEFFAKVNMKGEK